MSRAPWACSTTATIRSICAQAYGNSDFDRTHVINFNYLYQLPKFFPESSLAGKFADGWAIHGITVLQSGQPYSIIDYSGAVGSIFYGVSDGITNPIVPLAPGCTPQKCAHRCLRARFHGIRRSMRPASTCRCSARATSNGAIPAGDTFETNFTSGQRNIFRQPWQRRADISFVKTTKLTERFTLKYTLDVFNLTNTASFDIPIDDVSQNLFFNGFPVHRCSPTL